MIVVLDTNIVASATYWRGRPAHCLEAWLLGKYDLAISHPILTEYEEVITAPPPVTRQSSPRTGSAPYKQAGHLYLPLPRPPATADPDDEMLIECAAVARAHYLVTGDKAHLLALKAAAGIPIVAVSDFLRLIGAPDNPT